ncbi:unnamed protein product, partial [Symbiodinium sp. KB8]
LQILYSAPYPCSSGGVFQVCEEGVKEVWLSSEAGSNSVLDAMKREYTVEEFRTVVEVLTEKVPGMTLATDIICGFPTETEVIGDYKLAIVNISQFYPRPGTPAAKMKQLSGSIKKDRSRRLTKLFYSFDPYRDLLGKEFLVWTNTEYSNDGKHIVGHTKNYVKVWNFRCITIVTGDLSAVYSRCCWTRPRLDKGSASGPA